MKSLNNLPLLIFVFISSVTQNQVLAFDNCGSGCIQQFYVGLGTETTKCLYNGGSSFPINGSKSFSFTAPSVPGTYYFKSAHSLEYYCKPPASYDNTSADAVGVIVVTNTPAPSTILTVTDMSGNTGTCTANVTVLSALVFPYHTPAPISFAKNDLSFEKAKRIASVNQPLKVYPNPANRQITINIEAREDEGKATIYDNLGRVVWTNTIERGVIDITVDVSGNYFSNGFYLVNVVYGDFVQTKRFIVAK